MFSKKILLYVLLVVSYTAAATGYNDSAFVETKVTLHTKTGDIFGTLTTPVSFKDIPVALIIAGSGPTDRNGNNPYAMNAGLQKLSYALVAHNIASLRFDKRGIAESSPAMKSETD